MWLTHSWDDLPEESKQLATLLGLLLVLSVILWYLAKYTYGFKQTHKKCQPAQLIRGGSVYLSEEGKTVRRSARWAD